MKLLTRAKRFWELTKKDKKALDVLENLSQEQLEIIPNETEVIGEFFSEGSAEEYEELQKEDNGLKPWYERIKKL